MSPPPIVISLNLRMYSNYGTKKQHFTLQLIFITASYIYLACILHICSTGGLWEGACPEHHVQECQSTSCLECNGQETPPPSEEGAPRLSPGNM